MLLRRLESDSEKSVEDALKAMTDNSRINRSLALARSELAELTLLCHLLVGESNEDNLVNLKVNRFTPALTRLRKELDAASGDDESDTIEDLIHHFDVSVFGEGFTRDEAHQTLELGDGGLYASVAHRIALRTTGEELTETVQQQLHELDAASEVLVAASAAAMSQVASKAERSLSTVFSRLMVLGICIAMLFAGLTIKIVRGMQRHLVTLHDSEEKVRAITTAAQDAIIMMDSTGRIAFWNDAAQRVFGWSEQEIMGRMLHETIMPTKYLDAYHQAFELFRGTGEGDAIGQTLKTKALHKSGAEVPIELSLSAFTLDGKWCLIGMARDIRQRLEDERIQVRLKAAIESASETIVITNIDGVIEYANPAFEWNTGYSLDEAIGANPRMLNSGKHDDAFFKDMWITITSGEVWQGRLINKKKDGTTFYEDSTISPIKNEAGKIISYVAVKRDVTQQRTMETQLLSAQKLESIGQLAAGIAHEINTPTQYVGDNTRFVRDGINDLMGLIEQYGVLLTSAKGGGMSLNQIELIESSIEELDLDFLREEIPRAIEQTLEGVDRVAEIVRAMKDFSHPGGEVKTPTDMNKAIESTLTVCRNRWKYVAELETHFQSDLPRVPCLVGEFNQVILNLVVNAADAISERSGESDEVTGRITVSTRSFGDWAEIRVSDAGGGVPEDIQQKIFDPFFTTKDVGKGTGQGLTISHDVIVNKHDGTITLDVDPGVGTTFIILLPLGMKPTGKNLEAA